MPIEQDDAMESVRPDRAGDIAEHGNEGLQRKRDGADFSHVVMREAVRDRGRHDHRKVVDCIGRLDRQMVRDADIDILWTVRAMLFHRAHRHDDDRLLLQRRQQLMA
jgi:hypothetical protein